MEDSLNLNELIEIYKAIIVRDWETQRIIFGAQGGDLPEPFAQEDSSKTVADVMKATKGDDSNDLADFSEDGFSVGSEFGYEIE